MNIQPPVLEQLKKAGITASAIVKKKGKRITFHRGNEKFSFLVPLDGDRVENSLDGDRHLVGIHQNISLTKGPGPLGFVYKETTEEDRINQAISHLSECDELPKEEIVKNGKKLVKKARQFFGKKLLNRLFWARGVN